MILCSSVSFKGQSFFGVCPQPHGRTITHAIEEAFQTVLRSQGHIRYSSRLDAGVHAEDFLIQFIGPHTPQKPSQLKKQLNGRLYYQGDAITIKECWYGGPHHPRINRGKWYQYHLWMGERCLPFLDGWIHHTRPCSLDKIQEILHLFEGTHNFSVFRTHDCQSEHPIKHIFQIGVRQNLQYPEWIIIDIIGSGFLKQMVRILVGLGLYYAQNRISYQDIQKSLDYQTPLKIKPVLPAHGLVLKYTFDFERPLSPHILYDLYHPSIWSWVRGETQHVRWQESIQTLLAIKPNSDTLLRTES